VGAGSFRKRATSAQQEQYEKFCTEQAAWLDDFSLFMALKGREPKHVWTSWEPEVRSRDSAAMAHWRAQLRDEIDTQMFMQYVFFTQWNALRQYCHVRSIRLMGDLPIYVAHDSADVWANPHYFQLDSTGNPIVVAGVPPDYFSATGQLWGN